MFDAGRFIHTKILATVGPACAATPTLLRLIEEGARVFRLNFSHGSFDDHARALAAIREAEKEAGVPVGVLGDLCGPKIRVGKVREGGIPLGVGDRVEFQAEPIVAGADRPAGWEPTETDPAIFSVTLPTLIDDAQPGHRLLIDDGNVRCLVVERSNHASPRLVCRVTVGGRVTSGKGVNLPDSKLRVPSITPQDWACVDWAVAHELDFVALSFVRAAADVVQLREGIVARAAKMRGGRPADGGAIPIVSKIEKPEAIAELDAIVKASDAVMVARGDLGVEMELARVPLIQRRVIRSAQAQGRPVIVATQMLQSMVESPTPTRAEVSDVANAIFDGADAVMLSGETAVGKWPVQAVHQMALVARAAHEGVTGATPVSRPATQEGRYRTAALAAGVAVVVQELDAKLVVTWSEAGGGARYLSQTRLGVPILAASSSRAALRRMTILHGVCPLAMDRPENTQAFLASIDRILIEQKWAHEGDAIVVVKGEPIGTRGVTNELLIHYVGDLCRLGGD